MNTPFDLHTLLRLAAADDHPHLQNPHRYHIPSSTTSTPHHPTHHPGHHQPQKQAFIPPFDVLETPTAYILEGELPGLHDKKQTVIEFTDAQSVLIRGRIGRQDGDEENNESLKASVEGEGEGAVDKVWVAERNVGEFQRGFTLPGSVDVERVEATLEYGVLRIIVPKLAKAGVRRVEIQ